MNDTVQHVDQDFWFRVLFSGNPQPMYIYDQESLAFLAVNAAALAHYGYTRDEFMALTARDIRPPEEVPALLHEIETLVEAGSEGFHKSSTRHHCKKDGTLIFVETAKLRLIFAGRPAVCVLVNDVTEREEAEARIRHLAYHDEHTGLPNHKQLRCDVGSTATTFAGSNRAFSLLLVEMMRQREINYTLGHTNGDDLIRQVAERIRSTTPEVGQCYYLGGAQFALLLPDMNASEAIREARRLLHRLQAPFEVGGINYELESHVGISLFPGHGSNADLLIQRADVALYQANRSGQIYAIYNADQDPYKPSRLEVLGEIRQAIEGGQLQLYCQPKANLRTGQIHSAEALVRWCRPGYGLVAPDTFIPLIEPTELIRPLTHWMLEAAVGQSYAWQQAGLDLQLAVNLSTRNLLDPSLRETIYDLMQTWGLDVKRVALEITEGSLMTDPATARRVLEQLSAMGFELFVDDYGTGYSSLSYLMKLPVTGLKIDQAFTMAMTTDQDAAAIVRSTIEMAHSLNLKVVAEGVATRAIWDAVRAMGCDEAQGQYVGAPMPAAEFADWLAKTSGSAAPDRISGPEASSG